jgi:hypothetical protein
MLILFLNWKSPFPQVLLQSFEVLGRNGSGRSFAFVFAPSPKKGCSFKSIDSYFLRRLSMAGQRNTGRDEAFHREVIVWHILDSSRQHTNPWIPGDPALSPFRQPAAKFLFGV